MRRPWILWIGLLIVAGFSAAHSEARREKPAQNTIQSKREVKRVAKTEKEWQKALTPEQYKVLRNKGTEFAFTGAYWNHHENGTYRCAACGLELFGSKTKFDSGTGWPSFYQPIDSKHVRVHRDVSFGMVREEVLCAGCDGHLGHVFDDGPKPTNLRYCINSASLTFAKDAAKSK